MLLKGLSAISGRHSGVHGSRSVEDRELFTLLWTREQTA